MIGSCVLKKMDRWTIDTKQETINCIINNTSLYVGIIQFETYNYAI